ncbi:ankyrin repeat-containing domain protein [Baffinella frigidus]|nr:ankyrin repeat-containing domain protein [Cryptophyta sp. CCMP2293]
MMVRHTALVLALIILAVVPALTTELVDEAGLKAQQAALQLEQDNAIRVLYGAKAAIAEKEKGGDVAAKFAELFKNITFPSEESKQNSINTAFVSACSEGTVPEVIPQNIQVNLLLENKADINAKLDGQQEGAEGFTALMWAAYGGHTELVGHLIDKAPTSPESSVAKAWVLQNGEEGTTAGYEGGQRTPVARATTGVPPRYEGGTTACCNGGTTCGTTAGYDGGTTWISSVYPRGAGIEDKSTRGYTALILAATGGSEELVELFLEKGANLEAKGDDGGTALLHAAASGQRKGQREG